MQFLNCFFCVAILSVLLACSENSTSSDENLPLYSSEQGHSQSGDEMSSASPIGKEDSIYSSAINSSSSVAIIDTVVKWVGNSSLKINEIMPKNISFFDDLGKDPGWIELYNASDIDVNLEGYSLVEKSTKPRKWVFGKEIIPAKGFRIVFASNRDIITPITGTDSDSLHFRTHTNWKLEDEGGTVFLIDSAFGIRDSASYPILAAGISWGRIDGSWKYFDTPTPEEDNSKSKAFVGLTTVPVFDVSGGFYSAPITITPPIANENSIVRCTFDGSIPTKNTPQMTSSVTIDSNTVVRCANFEEGMITNKVTTNSYFINETVDLPVVSISVDPYDMFDSLNGYYSQGVQYCSEPCYAANFWRDIELPVHVEFYEKGSSSNSKSFELDAGLSIMGAWSRANPKKSVSISMHEEYQSGRIIYPLYATRPENNVFRAFNLRNNGNRYYFDYIEDALCGHLLEGSGVIYQRSRQVVVFYNGRYFGIHDMREKLNEYFSETNYGVNPSVVESIKHSGEKIEANGGTIDGYKALLNFVASADFSDSNSSDYSIIKTMLDIGEFADYMAAEIYYHNGDWPDNNVRAYRNGPDSLWKFALFDVDHGFYFEWGVNGFSTEYSNMFHWIKKGGTNGCKGEKCFAQIFNKLILNPNFKRLFVNRSAVMLSYYFNEDVVTSAIDKMNSSIPTTEVERDIKRWKRWREPESDGKSLKNFATKRINQIKPEYRDEFSLGNDITVSIKTTGNGSVRIEGMKLPGSTEKTTNYTGKFFSGTQMLLQAIPYNGINFAGWNDGSKENPRLVSLTEDVVYTATFK